MVKGDSRKDDAPSKKILLVDDDEIINFLNQKILARLGIEQIRTVLHGEQALMLLANKAEPYLPDTILLDLNMPVMNGFEFIRAFQKLDLPGKEKIKIVIITSSLDPADMLMAESLGVTHYLPKPISENDLRRVLQL